MSNSNSSFDRYPYMKHSTAELPKVKLTFEEWWKIRYFEETPCAINDAKEIWKAAQENK